jgi:hypothetical protein
MFDPAIFDPAIFDVGVVEPPPPPPPVVVPAETLTEVLKRNHRRAVRLLFLEADLQTVRHEVAGKLLGGSVSTDRGRELRTSASVTVVNDDGAYAPLGASSLVAPLRPVRIERGAYVNGSPQYVSLITGLLAEPTVKARGAEVSFRILSRLMLADVQFPQPISFPTGTRLREFVHVICALAGLGTADAMYDLEDGGAALSLGRPFDVSDNMLQGLSKVTYDHGLELYDDGLGRVVLRPFVDPSTAPPAWTFEPGLDSQLVDLSWTLHGRRIPNRQDVVGYDPVDGYPLRASVRDLNPLSPTYNPPDGSGPVGDIPAEPYPSHDIRDRRSAFEVGIRLLYERTLGDGRGEATASPIPLLSAGNVVRFNAAGIDVTTWLQQVDMPLGDGTMSMRFNFVRSLVAP